jgi:hypothetical protein
LKSKSEYGEISLSIQKRNEEEIASCPLTCLVRCHGPDPNSERAKYHLLNYTNMKKYIYSWSDDTFSFWCIIWYSK